MVSAPNRSAKQCPHSRNPPWLPSGTVFWTIPHEALLDQNQASTPKTLQLASAKVWLQSRMEYPKCRRLLRRRPSSLILASTVGETLDKGLRSRPVTELCTVSRDSHPGRPKRTGLHCRTGGLHSQHQEQKKHININFRYWDDIVGTGSQKAGPCQFTGPCVLCGNG